MRSALAALGTREDMVERQVLGMLVLAAVLTAITVANVDPRTLHRRLAIVPANMHVMPQTHHRRHREGDRRRMQHIVAVIFLNEDRPAEKQADRPGHANRTKRFVRKIQQQYTSGKQSSLLPKNLNGNVISKRFFGKHNIWLLHRCPNQYLLRRTVPIPSSSRGGDDSQASFRGGLARPMSQKPARSKVINSEAPAPRQGLFLCADGEHRVMFPLVHIPMASEKVDKYFLAAIVESSQDSIISVDSRMLITSWNKAAERIYGYAKEEVIGKPLTRLTRDQDLKMITAKVKQVMDGKVVKVFGTERIGKDNEKLDLEILMSPVKDAAGIIIGASTIARDVSLSRKAEKAFRDREVMAKVLAAHEEERARLARDLHDELGQEVTALRFKLKSVRDTCGNDEFREQIEEMESVIEAIDRNIDFIAWDLRPAGLEFDSCLSTAINNYTKQWSRHTGIPIKRLSRLPYADTVLSAVDTNFYRIMQEALNNVRKHADATEVEITLKSLKGSLRLIISDNGKGFNLTGGRRKKRPGFGLVGMRERAALIGAALEIESAPGKGTTIYVTVPLSSDKPQTKAENK